LKGSSPATAARRSPSATAAAIRGFTDPPFHLINKATTSTSSTTTGILQAENPAEALALHSAEAVQGNDEIEYEAEAHLELKGKELRGLEEPVQRIEATENTCGNSRLLVIQDGCRYDQVRISSVPLFLWSCGWCG
jgi:hypothetical protein